MKIVILKNLKEGLGLRNGPGHILMESESLEPTQVYFKIKIMGELKTSDWEQKFFIFMDSPKH